MSKHERLRAAQDRVRSLARLKSHELVSSPSLDLLLLKKGEELPVWRGPILLLCSWLLPMMAGVGVATPESLSLHEQHAQLVFLGLGACALMVGVVFLGIDARQWLRWWLARRSVLKGKCESRFIGLFLGGKDYRLVSQAPEGEWECLGQWCNRVPEVRAVWEQWNRKKEWVRVGDMRQLEQVLLEWTASLPPSKDAPEQG